MRSQCDFPLEDISEPGGVEISVIGITEDRDGRCNFAAGLRQDRCQLTEPFAGWQSIIRSQNHRAQSQRFACRFVNHRRDEHEGASWTPSHEQTSGFGREPPVHDGWASESHPRGTSAAMREQSCAAG